MLDETKADELLESIMKRADDDVLKAKTPEEKEKAMKIAIEWHKVYNDRLKTQNEHLSSESKIELDVEKMENEKAAREESAEAEKLAKRRDFWGKVAIKAVEFGFMLGGTFISMSYNRNNIIETDSMSRAIRKATDNRLGDYIRGDTKL